MISRDGSSKSQFIFTTKCRIHQMLKRRQTKRKKNREGGRERKSQARSITKRAEKRMLYVLLLPLFLLWKLHPPLPYFSELAEKIHQFPRAKPGPESHEILLQLCVHLEIQVFMLLQWQQFSTELETNGASDWKVYLISINKQRHVDWVGIQKLLWAAVPVLEGTSMRLPKTSILLAFLKVESKPRSRTRIVKKHTHTHTHTQ